MKYHGVKRIWNSPYPFYLKKKHFCADCGTILDVIKVSRIVDSTSPEAEKFDFSLSTGGYAVGKIKFIWNELTCPQCGRQYTVEEIRHIETERKASH